MGDGLPNIPIEKVRIREPVRIREGTPLLEVVLAMKAGRRGNAVIEDGAGRITGILTERDLLARLDHRSQAWQGMPVDEVMVRDPKTILVSQYLHEALATMLFYKFRHLPIVDRGNRVLGIVSIRDIILHVASQYPQEFLNLPPDPRSEASNQFGG